MRNGTRKEERRTEMTSKEVKRGIAKLFRSMELMAKAEKLFKDGWVDKARKLAEKARILANSVEV